MHWSRQFIPTLRDVPQEAEIPSHRLLLRAGMIRRLTGGLYTYLPLGLRALHKIEQIIREEMDRAGALEILMPALQPREIWEESGRYAAMGEVMFNIRDRQDRYMVLGPTHEEVATGIAAAEIQSYRQLPVNFYQIQTKFRDEIRPRFGLMRSKEFIMKDAYSFDVDWDAADVSYRAMYDAYCRVFRRCGLRTTVVEADTGPMGGSVSHEFMVVAEAGEDGIVECPACGYAANLQRAEGRFALPAPGDAAPLETVATPGARTIHQVASLLGVDPARLIKTLVYVADDRPVAVLLPGHRELNEIKLAQAVGAGRLAPAGDDVVEQVTGAPVGFAGPVGLSVPVYADRSLEGARDAVTGANRKDAHHLHVDLARDAAVTGYADLVLAASGDGCPRCDGTLVEKRGIEVGHVFKLGTKYSEAFGATFVDPAGASRPAVMGCYGIGVSRTLQSAIEQQYDAQGIIWPISIAPYQVEIVVLNVEHAPSLEIAETLVRDLEAAGVEVLVDDRAERPGVKFKDADLIGIPIRVAIGERSLQQGQVEIKLRRETDVAKVPAAEAAAGVLARVAALRAELTAEA